MVVEKHQERIVNEKKRKFRRPFQKQLNGVYKGNNNIGKEKDKCQNASLQNDSSSIDNSTTQGRNTKNAVIVENMVNNPNNVNSKKDSINNSETKQVSNNDSKHNYNIKDNFNASSDGVINKSSTNNGNNGTTSDSKNKDQTRGSHGKNKGEKHFQPSGCSNTKQVNTKAQNSKQSYQQFTKNSGNQGHGGSNYHNGHSYAYHNYTYNLNSGINSNNDNVPSQTQCHNRNDRFAQDRRVGGNKSYYYGHHPNGKKHYYNYDYRKQTNSVNTGSINAQNNTGGGSTSGKSNGNTVVANAQTRQQSYNKSKHTTTSTSSPVRYCANNVRNVSHTPSKEGQKQKDKDENGENLGLSTLSSDGTGKNADSEKDSSIDKVTSNVQIRRDSVSQGATKHKNSNANVGGKSRGKGVVQGNNVNVGTGNTSNSIANGSTSNNSTNSNGAKNKESHGTSTCDKEHNASKSQQVSRAEQDGKTTDMSENRKPRQNSGNISLPGENKTKSKHENGSFGHKGGGSIPPNQHYNTNYYYYNNNKSFGNGDNLNSNTSGGAWKGGVGGQAYHKQNYNRYGNAKTQNKYVSGDSYAANAVVHGKQVNGASSNNPNRYQRESESCYSADSKKNKRRYSSGGKDCSTNSSSNNTSNVSNNEGNEDDYNGSEKREMTHSDEKVVENSVENGEDGGSNAASSEVTIIPDSGNLENITPGNNSHCKKEDLESAKGPLPSTSASHHKTEEERLDADLGKEKEEKETEEMVDEKERSAEASPNKITTAPSSDSISNENEESCGNGDNSNAVPTSSSSTLGPGICLWRRGGQGNQVVDSMEVVKRTVKSLLNKITVEKFPIIAEKLAVCIDNISNVNELEELVKQVLDKAITEPDFSEMYADLCQILKWRSPILIKDEGATIGFGKALLLRCEHEFKNLPKNMTPTDEERELYDSDEIEIIFRKRKLHVLGIIRLIGELFIRRMFPMRSLNELVFDLVMTQEKPDEYGIECLCQLIMTTGYYLDSNEKSQMIVDQWFGRLKELQRTQISARLDCLIQDVFDLRKHKWVKKVHKQKAKALADIMKDIDVEDVLGGAAIAAQYGSVVVVGERSNLVGNSAYNSYMTSQEELYLSRQKNHRK